jgi:signal transduction histidine kinase
MRTHPWVGRPFPGFLLLGNNFVPVIHREQWAGTSQGIKVGDILVEMNGVPVTRSDEVRRAVLSAPVGTVFTYKFVRRGQTLERSIPTALFPLKSYIGIHAVWFSISSAFMLMGLTVFYLKPNDSAPRAFLLLGMVSAFSQAPTPDYCMTNQTFLPLTVLNALGPSIVVLSLYFPVKLGHRRPVIAVLAATTALIVAANLYYFHRVFTFIYFDNLFLFNLILTFGLGIIIMVRSFLKSRDPVVRQKAKIVIYGFAVAAVLSGLVLFAAVALKVMNFSWLFVPTSLMPLSVAYAIGKHNLFDVDVLIRRSASYLAVSALAVAFTLLLLNAINLGLMSTGQSAEIASVITILIMAVLFRPLRDRVDRAIERRFFGERLESQRTIRRAAGLLNSIIALDELLNQVLDTVMDALKIERGVLLIKERGADELELVQDRDYSRGLKPLADADPPDPPRFPLDHPLFLQLRDTGRAIQINDLERLFRPGRDRDAMAAAMRGLGIVLAVPIMYERRLIGALGLGPRSTGALYASEDIELFETLMIQAAVSIENARKVEELKKMVELETSYRELQKLDEMKDNFLSMVSHDLRTPMTGIKAYASIMREKVGAIAEADQKKYLDIIIQQSDRLILLINDLLDVQRFEAGRMSLEMQDLDLVPLVDRAAEAFAGACALKNIRLEKALPGGPIIVPGNEDRLEQVLANLLSNACKFTPANGSILVTAETIFRDGASPAARVSVMDTGPGIPAELRTRLFEKFSQLRELVRNRDQGSGLGLALARQIVEYHGGRIGLLNRPGGGAEFFFLIPAREWSINRGKPPDA